MGFMKPKKPKIPDPPPAPPTIEDAGSAAQSAVMRERRKRGYASQLLTSGGAEGLSKLGPVGTQTLLGGFK